MVSKVSSEQSTRAVSEGLYSEHSTLLRAEDKAAEARNPIPNPDPNLPLPLSPKPTLLRAEDEAAVEGAHRRRAAQVVPAVHEVGAAEELARRRQRWVLVAQPQHRAHGQLRALVRVRAHVARAVRAVRAHCSGGGRVGRVD